MTARISADLHVHTCLSPCGDDLATPKAIVQVALERGLGIIGISDHNSAENVKAAIAAAGSLPLTVLPGMEVSSVEEVHLLSFFADLETALRAQEFVYGHLQPGENNELLFGYQYIVDEEDYVLGESKRLLIGSTDLSVDQIVSAVHGLEGVCIASHVDRDRYGLLYQLGFIPETLALDAVEITSDMTVSEVEEKFGVKIELPVIYSSDSHFAKDVGKNQTCFEIEAPTFSEVVMALRSEKGRRLIGRRKGDV